MIKNVLKNILNRIPFFKRVLHKRRIKREFGIHPPCHFHSPIPSIYNVIADKDRIFNKENKEIYGIDFRTDEQMKLVEHFKNYYHEIPFDFTGLKNDTLRYKCEGAFYIYSDVVFLYCMMRHFKPKQIIEIGSGFSSAIMLDVNELFLKDSMNFVFIDPDPERLYSLIRADDIKNSKICEMEVQDVDVEIFKYLKSGDFLFIDSSHVSKTGSDVNYVLFEILPLLKSGVFIHFHDIFYPFEYPIHWITERKWFWNELYLLRAFLTDNDKYEIIVFNSFLQYKFREWFELEMPICLENEINTGGIWIRKK